MPIFHDRIADQVEELLPDFYQKDGPRFVSFLKSYFEFLEKGQLVYKEAADIDYIGLEDGTTAGEAFNSAGERGNLLQESGTYAPSSVTSAKFNYEIDIDSGGVQKTSFEKDEFVVGSTTGAIGRVDVIGNSSNLYIEQFSEAQFDIDETIVGKTSGMEAKVASFTASPLHAANNLLSYADVDKTSGDFLEYFRRDFMPFIDRDVLANKRLLQKHVQELYLSKGSKESYEFLFRILYGLEAEVSFPGDNVIKPSESEFSEPTVMRLFSNKDLTVYKNGQVKKLVNQVVTASSYINDASGISSTNDTTNAYELELILPHIGTFNVGDTVILSDRDGLRADTTATVRGVMTDIDPNESSIYLGQEDGNAGDIEDILREESSTAQYIIDESGGKVLFEDDDEMVFEHGIGGNLFQARPIGIEDGTGIILSEESVYDLDDNLITDYAILDENTDLFELDSSQSGGPDSRTMGGGLYTEQASKGSLYSESDTFNYNSPAGGTATQSVNVIGSISRGGVTDIVIDDAGTGYSVNDQVVFVNTGTEGNHAEAFIEVTDGNIELESATEPGIHEFTGDGSTTVFSGRDNSNITMGFDPRKVQVFVAGTEIVRTTGFTTDQAGTKITFASAPANSALIEVILDNRGVSLEDSQQTQTLLHGYGEFVDTSNIIANEASGAIRKISISNNGLSYKTLPQVFMGGYIYYDTMTTGTTFSVGEVITESGGNGAAGSNIQLIVVEHDTTKKRLLVYKRTTDTSGVPSGTITGGTSSASCTITQTNVTAGNGAKLWAYSDTIGSIEKLKIQDPGHDFDQGGIGNYKQHAILRDISGSPVSKTTVTAALTGSTATVRSFNGDLNMLTLENVKGIFNDGDYVTTSDSKNFYIGKINPCTSRGKLGSESKLDGNYLNDTGFPSVDSMRIHDSKQYQDFSYLIKVGKSINEYRSLVKSLLSPAGTIFFGEVSIRSEVDGSAAIYNVDFDGTNTTRSFIPTLIIGSKIDTADIELEEGTDFSEDSVFSSFKGRVLLETGEGVMTTERFLATSSSTVKDQSSGQPYILGTDTVEETDRDFFKRQLTAEVTAKGSRVNKQLMIYPHYNQHKISYTTLDNALAVGTKVKGGDTHNRGIVIEHDTTNKFIIIHTNLSDQGKRATEFSGTEAIEHIDTGANYFTATSIELHHAPDDIVSNSSQSTAITPDTTITSANQKISNGVEGGGDTYAHADYISGFHGRGRKLTANDPNETYDSEMRQRKVNIISSPLFTQATTQRGRTFSAGVKQTRTLNTQSSRTVGSNTKVTNLTGTALRIDSSLNTTVAENKNGVSFGHRPAGQKLFESASILSERIMTEDGDNLIFEPQSGRILGETDFGQGGTILNEDGTYISYEDATIADYELVFVSEESSQLESFNLIDETNGNRLIDETSSKPLLLEEAYMIGQKDSSIVGPTIGDLGDMMFTENYSMMKKIQLDGGSGISSGDDLLLETGEHCLLESPSEGIRISDISTLYPNRFVSGLQNELHRRSKLNYSAVVQSG
tara:strand:+ start:3021 stop:7571 length:4551 start_codon:yes stop_codon:yes gene_type:complete